MKYEKPNPWILALAAILALAINAGLFYGIFRLARYVFMGY